jgi:hypothetical protein
MISNDSKSAGRLQRTRVISLLVLGAAIAFVPRAQAALDFNPVATATLIHDSNVFARPSDEPPFVSRGNTELGDTIQRYLIGATADFTWGLDRLSLNAQGERFDYNRFDELNHYANKFGGAFDWFSGGLLDGTVSYSQARQMAPLADTLSEQLELQTDKSASAAFRLHVSARWRLDLTPTWHQFDSPLPDFADFGYRETGGSAAINYLGIQKLTAGVRVEYLSGRYFGIVDATRYHQTTGQLTADYAVSGFSSFNAQAGYTQRRNTLIDPDTAIDAAGGGPAGLVGNTTTFTGQLGFRRQLSVKTSVNLRVFREVDSYVAGANSEIGTGGEANVEWKPDVKFTVTLRYRMATESIQGTLVTQNVDNRTDHTRNGQFDVEYHIRRWLTLRPFYIYDARGSNFHEARFVANVVGVDLTAHLH